MKTFAFLALLAAFLALPACTSAQAKSDLHTALEAADVAVTAAEQDPTLIPKLADAAAKLDSHNQTLFNAAQALSAAATSGNLNGLHQVIQAGLVVAAPTPTPSPSPGP